MTQLHAIFLGFVQGLTEFLPISSSGHLVVFQQLLGLVEPGIAFEISVHLGTLAAVVIFFRKEISEVNEAAVAGIRLAITGKGGFSQLYVEDPGFRMAMLLAAGSGRARSSSFLSFLVIITNSLLSSTEIVIGIH